ncbi:hypothetical protein OG249_36835 [Streptomyces microflavus]|uniref:hypothetical protein n=1 Tax=Streptomyces microflavus TaxID=1919 RepID=UPI00225788F0|nr:hypothetical protein [Streptomyces microflavus]MCX4657428.1 hypothetical protein [Streptomyces microflavus]
MQHLKPPAGCTPCRSTWSYLRSRYLADVPAGAISITMIAAGVGIAPRTQRVHLTVLVEAGHVDMDRRTPLHPVTPPLPPPTTPGRWAATVTLPCDTCRRVLTVVAELAGADWTTRGITRTDLAQYARMTPKTWTAHVKHLEKAQILRTEADSCRADDGRWDGSRPDRYVLLSGSTFDALLTTTGTQAGARWFENAAHELLTDVAPWATGSKLLPSDRQALLRRVAGHMEYGHYPRDVLRRMIARRTIRPHHGITDAYALLISLLPPPMATYTPSMGEVTGVVGRRTLCLTCEHPHEDPAMPEGVMCAACARTSTPAF